MTRTHYICLYVGAGECRCISVCTERGLLREWAARRCSSWTLTSTARQASSSWLMTPCILSLLPTIMAIPSFSSVWGARTWQSKYLRSSVIQIWYFDEGTVNVLYVNVLFFCCDFHAYLKKCRHTSQIKYEHIYLSIYLLLFFFPALSHLLCLVYAGDRLHLTVFVSSEYLTHGACGNTVGHTVNVDLFLLVHITHGRFFLALRCWLAAVKV